MTRREDKARKRDTFEIVAEDAEKGVDRLVRIAHRVIADSEKLRAQSSALRERMMKGLSV
jgi:hypothetical protein